MSYMDLHHHVSRLEEQGLLHRVNVPIDKNTELHPLVRLQFVGQPESARKAFLFESVTDCRGTQYSCPVLVGGMAASRAIYALGMGCKVEEIPAKWMAAMERPLKPAEVGTGRVQEVVHMVGANPASGTGLDIFPVPVSTPGWDPAPFLTCAHWISKHPESGAYNVGNYRGHRKRSVITGSSLPLVAVVFLIRRGRPTMHHRVSSGTCATLRFRMDVQDHLCEG